MLFQVISTLFMIYLGFSSAMYSGTYHTERGIKINSAICNANHYSKKTIYDAVTEGLAQVNKYKKAGDKISVNAYTYSKEPYEELPFEEPYYQYEIPGLVPSIDVHQQKDFVIFTEYGELALVQYRVWSAPTPDRYQRTSYWRKVNCIVNYQDSSSSSRRRIS